MMLQNLLGAPPNGLSSAALKPGNPVDGPVQNVDSDLIKVDNSLINKDYSAVKTQVEEPLVAATSGALAGVGMPSVELTGQLRLALDGLLQEFAKGSEMPLVGNVLPDTLPPDIEAGIAQLSQLELKLGSGAAGPGTGELQALVDHLQGLINSLEAALPTVDDGGDAVNTGSLTSRPEDILPPVETAPVAVAKAIAQAANTPVPVEDRTLVGQAGSTPLYPARVQALGAQLREVLSGARGVLQQAQSVEAGGGKFVPAQDFARQTMVQSPGATLTATATPAVQPLIVANEKPAAVVPDVVRALPALAASMPGLANPAILPGDSLTPASRILHSTNAVAGALTQSLPVGPQVNPAELAARQPLAASLLQASGAAATSIKHAGKNHPIEALGALLPAQGAAGSLVQPPGLTSLASSSVPIAAQTFATNVALPVINGQWGNQIAQRIGWLTGQGINTADIHLNPPELGPMQVRIDSSDNAARVTISVHNAMTREALETQLPRLRDLFSEQGLDLVDVDVDNRDFTGGDSQAADGEEGNDDSAGNQTAKDGQLATDTANAVADLPAAGRAGGDTIVLSYALVDAYA